MPPFHEVRQAIYNKISSDPTTNRDNVRTKAEQEYDKKSTEYKDHAKTNVVNAVVKLYENKQGGGGGGGGKGGVDGGGNNRERARNETNRVFADLTKNIKYVDRTAALPSVAALSSILDPGMRSAYIEAVGLAEEAKNLVDYETTFRDSKQLYEQLKLNELDMNDRKESFEDVVNVLRQFNTLMIGNVANAQRLVANEKSNLVKLHDVVNNLIALTGDIIQKLANDNQRIRELGAREVYRLQTIKGEPCLSGPIPERDGSTSCVIGRDRNWFGREVAVKGTVSKIDEERFNRFRETFNLATTGAGSAGPIGVPAERRVVVAEVARGVQLEHGREYVAGPRSLAFLNTAYGVRTMPIQGEIVVLPPGASGNAITSRQLNDDVYNVVFARPSAQILSYLASQGINNPSSVQIQSPVGDLKVLA